jgi:PhnB protein
MTVNPYLFFNGNCEEAFRFYADRLGGSIVSMQTYGEGPDCSEMPIAPEKIMHAQLRLGDQILMASDSPDEPKPISGYSLAITVDEPEEAERVFEKLAAGGRVQMPMEETFWAQRFGIVLDRFGVSWMVNCEK